jgi:retron-type reverse transcriptase
MIEGDIKGYFDNVDHHILAQLLERKVKDKRLIDLYWKLVKAGYVETGRLVESKIGVPQGGTLSPLLSNIYLHEFDEFIERKIETLEKLGKPTSKVNPKIVWYSTRLTRLSEKYRENKDPQTLKELKILRQERNTIPTRIRTGNKIYYTRYADD